MPLSPGRADHILKHALAIAIAAIDRLPLAQRPTSDRDDMLKLLEHIASPIDVEMYLNQNIWTLDRKSVPRNYD